MSDLSELIVAAAACAGTIGGGFAFIWRKIEARFEAIDEALIECEDRERAGQKRRSVQLVVIELLWQEVNRLAPDAFVLVRAKKLLDDLRDEALD
jgi:hypothetical protein